MPASGTLDSVVTYIVAGTQISVEFTRVFANIIPVPCVSFAVDAAVQVIQIAEVRN